MSFDPYLKAVGTGPKGNRNLSLEETEDAIRLILQGQVPPEVIGAFLIGLRIKEESMDELKGTKKIFDSMRAPAQNPLPDSVELSYVFSGKTKHPVLLPLIAQHIPEIDLVACVDSDIITQSHTLTNVHEALPFPSNIHLQDRSEFFLWLSALNSLRSNLKIRTVFNTVEKLLNPLESRFAIIGAHHTPYFKKYAELFGSAYERLIILQGDEGSSELFKKGKLLIVDAGEEVDQLTVDPNDFDIDTKAILESIASKDILTYMKEPDKNLTNLALLNAKITQLAAKRIDSLL